MVRQHAQKLARCIPCGGWWISTGRVVGRPLLSLGLVLLFVDQIGIKRRKRTDDDASIDTPYCLLMDMISAGKQFSQPLIQHGIWMLHHLFLAAFLDFTTFDSNMETRCIACFPPYSFSFFSFFSFFSCYSTMAGKRLWLIPGLDQKFPGQIGTVDQHLGNPHSCIHRQHCRGICQEHAMSKWPAKIREWHLASHRQDAFVLVD